MEVDAITTIQATVRGWTRRRKNLIRRTQRVNNVLLRHVRIGRMSELPIALARNTDKAVKMTVTTETELSTLRWWERASHAASYMEHEPNACFASEM